MSSLSQPKPRRIFYGWFIFAACFLSIFFALGFSSSPRSLFLIAITEDLGIPRSLYSLNDSIHFITKAALNVVFGAMIAKFGARKLITFGYVSLIGSMLVYSFANNIVTFYIGSVLLGVGLAWTTTSIVGHLVENWFASNKGTIMGIILAANGLGGAVASQFVSTMIHLDSQTAGWRLCYLMIAVGMAIVGIINLIVIRNRPEDMGLQPLGPRSAKAKKVRGEQWNGIPYTEARRRPYFWFGLIGIFSTGMVLQAIYGVASAHMKDCGLDPNTIANVLSVSSLFLAISKMGTGFVYDKRGLRFTMLICTGCAMGAILCLAFVSNAVLAYAYCVLGAFALPLETIMLPLIAKDLFGSHSFSKIMGLFVAVNTFGYAIGVPIMNVYFDLTGTYRPMMIAMGVIMGITAVVMQLVIAAARKDRAAVIAAAEQA